MSGILINSVKGILTKSSKINCLASMTIPKKFYHDNVVDNMIEQPYRHCLGNGSSRLLIKMCPVFNYWLKVPEEKMKEIVDLSEDLYAFFFIIDDVYDDTPIRMPIISTPRIYGIPVAVNTILCKIMETYETYKKLHRDAFDIFSEQSTALWRGQAQEMYWRDMIHCPTQEEYELNVLDMAGSFYLLGLKLLQLFSENKTNFDNLISKIALYAQLNDDYLDCSTTKIDKNYCSDLTTGSFSFPMVHAINNHPDDIEMKYLLRKRSTDKDIHVHFIKLLEKYGSYEYTNKRKTLLLDEIIEDLKKFERNPKMDEFILELKSGDFEE